MTVSEQNATIRHVNNWKSKIFLWIALLAIPMICGGIAAQILGVVHFNLYGLLLGWCIAMGGQALIVLFSPDNHDEARGLCGILRSMATAAFDMLLYGVGLGIFIDFVGISFLSYEKHGILGDWWAWGLGTALVLLTLWTISHRLKRDNQKRRAKIIRNIIGLGILFFIATILLGSRDGDPVPGDEHAFSGQNHPQPSDNAYLTCVAATNAVNNLPRKPPKDITGEEAVQIVKSNAAALALLHQAANCSAWYDEEVALETEFSVFPAMDFIRLHGLERIKIRVDIEHGRIHDALQTARDLAKHSRLMLGHAQTALTWCGAVAIRQSADEAIMDILASGKTTDDDLAEMREILSLTESAKAWDMNRLSQEEFQRFSSLVSRTAKSPYVVGHIKTDSVAGRYLFHPERTRSAASRLTAHYLQILKKPGYEQTAWEEADRKALQIMSDSISHRWLPGQNILGSLLLRIAVTNWKSIAHTKSQSEFTHDATRLSVAIEAHRRRTGKIPSRLDELIPAFIDAVPLDPFNLPSPLNYDSRQGIVWTIGRSKSCNGVRTKSKTDPYGPGNSKYVRNVNGTPLP